jgi:peptidyl-prolyl cis-trans isomerase A (cyclophilin A)
MKCTVLGAAAVLLALSLADPALAQRVKLVTSMGDIVVELDAEKAPKSVANFVQYAKSGHYNGTIFHRVIDGFMVQGGGFTTDMTEKPRRPPIPLEAGNGLSNVRGSVAMARTAAPDSASAQFYINVVDNLRLDTYGGGYAVFGKVLQGMEVVDRIKAVPTGTANGMPDVPLRAIVIKQAIILEK